MGKEHPTSEGEEGSELTSPLRASIFSRIVVGVDGSEPGFEACRQAGRLREPGGWLEVFTAVHLGKATHAGASAPRMVEEMAHTGQEALRKAAAIVGTDVVSKLVDGQPTGSLLRELARERATLVAVGTHGHSRASEIVLGGVAGSMLHTAPCSVLLARPRRDGVGFPSSLAVGVDGSEHAAAALAVARRLADRFDAPLHAVTALRGKDVDLDRVTRLVPQVEALDKKPLEALIEAAAEVDLLVVGCRGLHGLGALGSVSERVAHRAASSVLVVQGA
jgi:nucleotide-binding universal stress UspA family protein